MLSRLVFVFVAILVASAGSSCSKKAFLDQTVSAETAEEFAGFRARAEGQVSADELKDLDVALQELKLDAMHRGVGGTAAREQEALERLNGKTVRAALILGFEARRERFKRELADMRARYAHDSQLQSKAKTADSIQHFSNLLKNERDLIAQLERDLATAERKLAGFAAGPGSAAE